VCNKLSELELYISLENPDIIALTETWLRRDIADSEVSFDGYILFRRDRINSTKQGGGGVLIMVKNSLKPVLVSDYPNSQVEFLSCSIECGGGKTLIGICYRPDYSSEETDWELYNIINEMDYKYSVIFGDFNYSKIRWGEGEQNSIDKFHPFIECLDSNFLTQVVDKPTRGNNFLDLVLTSDTSIVDNLVVGENFGISDHQIIRFNLVGWGGNNSDKNIPIYNYYRADYNQIRAEIGSRGWGDFSQWGV